MFSQTIMQGNVATDPELKTIPTGDHVLTFNLAVDREARSVRGKPGVDFFPIEVWNNYAISLKSNLKKGDRVLVVGRAINRKVTKEGRYRTMFTTSQILFFGHADSIAYMPPPEIPEEAFVYDGQQQTIEEVSDYGHQNQ